jgi:soluble lytic murein transglycosylase-like protein
VETEDPSACATGTRYFRHAYPHTRENILKWALKKYDVGVRGNSDELC